MHTLDIATRVSAQYHRYLQSTFRFRDPALRDSFERALAASPLAKGPLLEGTPVFKPGSSLRELCRQVLAEQPDDAFFAALQGDRSLYWHQQESIRRVAQGRNVVVATGTGSGKTESFLFPILLKLWEQQRANALGPGVRALVLYPMNALANDQRDRLAAPPQEGEPTGGILHELKRRGSPFRFTFGQYIGQTPEDKPERDQTIFEGELATRAQMRATPPHVLLTNYSMLEYLLLRPSDSPLFDGANARTWQFLVLDEAHQYRGAKGIEMGMLIRRLKQRLRDAGHAGPFTCIATSASLSGGGQDRDAVARFASELFDEPFAPDDVITGDYQAVGAADGSLDLDVADYATLATELAASGPQVDALLTRHLGAQAASMPRMAALSTLLQRDRRAAALRRTVRGEPTSVDALAGALFPQLQREDGVQQIGALAELLAQLRDADGAPLLTGRYHVLLKAMESAFVTYTPEKRVTLDRRDPKAKASFEAALCRECGQHYFVGKIEEGKLVEALRDPGDSQFGAQFFRPIEGGAAGDVAGDGDSDDEPVAASAAASGATYELCTTCGAIGRKSAGCACGSAARVIRVVQESNATDRPDQIARCGACGYNASGHDPVRELQHGNDGPQAVVATSLFQNLPVARRKLLAFSDGRQEAAFFAWYFEESYRDVLSRNLILQALRDLGDGDAGSAPQSVLRMARALAGLFSARRVFGASRDADDLMDEAFRAVWREALSDERRISLEGVGALRWQWRLPDGFGLPAALTGAPFNLSEDEARRVVQLLLDSLRQSWSVELLPPKGVTVNWESLNLRQAQRRVGLDPGKGVKRASRVKPPENWDGPTTKRVRWLSKLLQRVDPMADAAVAKNAAISVLRALWDAVSDADRAARSDADKLFVPASDGRRINLNWLRARAVQPEHTLYRCDVCGRLQDEPVRGCCAHGACAGTPQPVRAAELGVDHYREVYRAELPAFLRAEEHTAQLNYKRAKEFQADFKEGKIQLLSSSTTFEVGVDLGDLSTVLLRNVPPEAFNYAQRVGRAGRRAGTLGLAVTYCRRSPHDLYHFAQPDRIIRGLSSPPNVLMRNDKIIGRHVTAWALAHFFRANAERFKTVDAFFVDLLQPRALADVHAHLTQHVQAISAALARVVPPQAKTAATLRDGAWIDGVAGPESRLADAQLEISTDFTNLTRLMNDAKAANDFGTAGWAQARMRTLAGDNVLSFLSKYGVIPKYGFPVDVVALDTAPAAGRADADVELQRDLGLAIAEFAPTAELIANKQLWTSYGLKRVPAREWPRRAYRRCRDHNTFVQWRIGEPEGQLSCGCARPEQQYIVPQFGFTTERGAKATAPTGKPNRLFSTRPYFAGAVGAEPDRIELKDAIGALAVSIGRASPGRMTMLCEGSKGTAFYVCPKCGFGHVKAQPAHKTPLGQPCDGRIERIALGHEFDTDVLRLDFPSLAAGADDIWLQLGVAYALANGAAEALDVPATDIAATVYPRPGAPPQILLYDNVPGGAGLVARLETPEVFWRAISLAARKVSGLCGCGEDESCYGCLRSYNNQFAHRNLRRGGVWRFLEGLGQMTSINAVSHPSVDI